ncbi:hypothetical protein GCM10012276_14060 [Nocardioides deserti]|nr:hypothetical protein GCM10012276_14060 [Nocardioides deserti]
MLDLEPGGTGEVDPLGPTVEHRLGADVDGDPGDLVPPDLAADDVRGLEHDDLVTGGDEVAGSGEAGDPGSHHDGPAALLVGHPPSVPPGPWLGTGGGPAGTEPEVVPSQTA